MLAGKLIRRIDGQIDLDTDEGTAACKKFLNQIERMCEVILLMQGF